MGKTFQRVEVRGEYDYSIEEYDDDKGSYIDADEALAYIEKLESMLKAVGKCSYGEHFVLNVNDNCWFKERFKLIGE